MSDVLTPKKTEQKPLATRRRDPLASFRRDVDRMMDQFWRGAPLTGIDWPQTGAAGWAAPAVEFSETDKAYLIKAELPGMDKADVEISLHDDMLVLSGEKHAETDETRESVHLNERRFGKFQRAFSLPSDVVESKIDARFDNGLLTISLPRSEEKRAAKTIKVK